MRWVEIAVALSNLYSEESDKVHTALGKRVGHRLRELAPLGQRELGGGIHAT